MGPWRPAISKRRRRNSPATRRNVGLLNLACALAFAGVWIEKGMGLIIPGFVPSTLHEVGNLLSSTALDARSAKLVDELHHGLLFAASFSRTGRVVGLRDMFTSHQAVLLDYERQMLRTEASPEVGSSPSEQPSRVRRARGGRTRAVT